MLHSKAVAQSIKVIIDKKCHYILYQRYFSASLQAAVAPKYKHENFRHAISSADSVEMIRSKMQTVKAITSKKKQSVHATIYSAAIQRAQQLHEYSECWRLYNEAKHESQVDIYLLTQMINITAQFLETQFMFDYAHQNSRKYNKSKLEVAKHRMLCRVHRLYEEMKNELHLQPTHATYSSLINACSKFKSFVGAQRYWEYYRNEKHLQPNLDVYAAIIYSKIHKTDIMGAVKLFHEMVNVQRIQPNAYIVTKLLSGFAHQIRMRKMNRSKFMEISHLIQESEDLLKMYVQQKMRELQQAEAENINAVIDIDIFNAICNVYASNGDITSCFDILHCLLDARLPTNSAYSNAEIKQLLPPKPNVYTFNTCLKSLVYCDELHADKDKRNIWRLADFLVEKMDALHIKKDCSTYATLFNLCGNAQNEAMQPDLDKAIELYTHLSNSVSVISRKCMYGLLLTGLQYYDFCEYRDHAEGKVDGKTHSQNKAEFIEWWLSEAKDFRVQCSLSLHQLLSIKAKAFRIPKIN